AGFAVAPTQHVVSASSFTHGAALLDRTLMSAAALCHRSDVASPQALSEADRRIVAVWAAAFAERFLAVFEAERPADDRPRDAIAR
ncbi:UNVERIFIED_CONTAM: hypothetical protein NY603_32125, partial [Bacteroidetes bacterium 56_B9]